MATVRPGTVDSPDLKSLPKLLGANDQKPQSPSHTFAIKRWSQEPSTPWVIDFTKRFALVRALDYTREAAPERPERSVPIVSFLLVANVPAGDCVFFSLAPKHSHRPIIAPRRVFCIRTYQ